MIRESTLWQFASGENTLNLKFLIDLQHQVQILSPNFVLSAKEYLIDLFSMSPYSVENNLYKQWPNLIESTADK